MIELSQQEAQDLLNAIREAQAELCVGEGFPEATAYSDRLDALAGRLLAGYHIVDKPPY